MTTFTSVELWTNNFIEKRITLKKLKKHCKKILEGFEDTTSNLNFDPHFQSPSFQDTSSLNISNILDIFLFY